MVKGSKVGSVIFLIMAVLIGSVFIGVATVGDLGEALFSGFGDTEIRA